MWSGNDNQQIERPSQIMSLEKSKTILQYKRASAPVRGRCDRSITKHTGGLAKFAKLLEPNWRNFRRIIITAYRQDII